MKRIIAVLAAVLIAFSAFPLTICAASEEQLEIKKENITHSVGKNLYGITLEDSSYSCDGGLVSELVCNGSFEYSAMPENAWSFENINAVLSTNDPMNSNNPTYETLEIDGKGTIKNCGYTEINDDNSAEEADMGFREGIEYEFSFYVKNIDFNGTVSVYLDSSENSRNVTKLSTDSVSEKEWTKLSATLKAAADEDGGLAIEFDGSGSIEIDFVSLVPTDSFGYGDEEWKYVTLRNDLVDAIKNLNPSFIRFPGGCLAEGSLAEELYSWKDTIGSSEQRKQIQNLYADDENKNYYNNTNSMGYHEYFQLCEELACIPVPVVGAGIACSEKSNYDDWVCALKKLDMTDEEWKAYVVGEKGYDENDDDAVAEYTSYIESFNIKSQSDFDKLVQTIALDPKSDEFKNYTRDILDLIEYANGDAETTYYGALRAANGHTEPFGIEYIQIGNENCGEIYERNYEALRKAIKEEYPDIKIIACSADESSQDGVFYNQDENASIKCSMLDEHYATESDSLQSKADLYDGYDRELKNIAVFDYCCAKKDSSKTDVQTDMESALSEAAFMTGFERNSDIVKMTSYSRMLSKINTETPDALVQFDSKDVVFTPDYYVQMLFSNNVGTKYIDTSLPSGTDENFYHSVTVDDEKQVIYVKLVNISSSSQKLTLKLDGFGNINSSSSQSISSGYKSVSNELSKQYAAPIEEELEANGETLEISVDGNSAGVVRITYGDNGGESLFSLPDNIDYSTKKYIPPIIKAIAAGVCISVPVGATAGYLIYTRIISKNFGKRRKND